MTASNRRDFLRAALGAAASTSLAGLPPAIARALGIRAHRRTGTLADVEHVVILTQENRSFDHYFGTLRGVRGFGDRFVVPAASEAGIVRENIWLQPRADAPPGTAPLAPFRLDTTRDFGTMRVEGTPHVWTDAQAAWDEGRMSRWPLAKQNHSLGYYTRDDIPFQFALAESFTLCDAYHCSFQGGTNPNRVFLWTGTNDPVGRAGGPVLYNDYDNLQHDPDGGYSWVTYCERLEQAGVRWQIYQNMEDNFTDNPVAGFRTFRAAVADRPGAQRVLAERGLQTRNLDLLRQDVLEGNLPQVSWVVATADGSEHPGPSSPAQGAAYTARVLDALTADPEVWSKTVLLLNFDENDGFFDHVPPPAVPSRVSVEIGRYDYAGASTVETEGEYHEQVPVGGGAKEQAYLHRPYGLGPRVPLYVISPWSKGGWVNSQVFDHTSIIRFLERRFGVSEPNISPWRRAVCGDLTSAFDFDQPERTPEVERLPDTEALAARARALPSRTTPPLPESVQLPSQEYGVRPSRALPYELHVHARVEPVKSEITLTFGNSGRAAAVFHVYDRLHLDRTPRRYTVEPGRRLEAGFAADDAGGYDLWVLGPNGFHRHFTGRLDAQALLALGAPEITVRYEPWRAGLSVRLRNASGRPHVFALAANGYEAAAEQRIAVAPHREAEERFSLRSTLCWYDFTVRLLGWPEYTRRFAGRMETGLDGFSDPLLGAQ